MPFCQASLAVPHRSLVLRHEGRSFISSLAFRYRKTRSRFYTACAASPAQHVLRAQARRSTNDPSCSSSSVPTVLVYPRRLLVRYDRCVGAS